MRTFDVFGRLGKLVLFYFLLVSMFVQVPIFDSQESGSTLNLYHVFLPLCLFYSRLSFQKAVTSIFGIFFAVLAISSLIGWSRFGLGIRAMLLPLAFMAYLCGYAWHHCTPQLQRDRMLTLVFYSVLIAVGLRNLLYFPQLSTIYSRSATTDQKFYLASGGNLEATQLGMLSTLFVNSKLYPISFFLAFTTSILMLSRSGILAVALSVLNWTLIRQLTLARVGLLFLGLLIVGAFIAKELVGKSSTDLSSRFNFESEQDLQSEGQGRLAIWSEAAAAILDNPWGYGVGNGFPFINSNDIFRENNCHNIYIEIALDGGIISSLVLISASIWLAIKLVITKSPFVGFGLSYLVLGIIQFTGYDAIGWFFLGVSQAQIHSEELNK